MKNKKYCSKECYKKGCSSSWKRRYREKRNNPETYKQILEKEREWRKSHKEWIKEREKSHLKKLKENPEKYLAYRKRNNLYNRKRNLARRLQVLHYYGGIPPKCACCGENHVEFLTIDHMYGKNEVEKKRQEYIYVTILRKKYPKDLQVLCMNCNWERKKARLRKQFCSVHHPELYIEE